MKKCLAVIVLAAALALLSAHVALARSELQAGGNVYYVSQGDTLAGIAARFGVTVEAILRQNGLPNPDMIYVGQALIIPTSGHNSGGGDYYNPGCANYHIVRHGETLSTIAWNYGVSVEALVRQNNLHNKDFVYVGQKLCVSGAGGSMSQAPGYKMDNSPPASHHHTVAQGETLSGICDRYGVNMWEVARANNLTNASFIQPGQQLAIPGYTPAPAAVTYKPAPSQPASPQPSSQISRPARPDGPPGGTKPSAGGGPKAPPKKSDKVYLRLGRNVSYEYWGRPDYGIDDCQHPWYDDGDPVKRLTIEVLVTNKSKREIPDDWAEDVVIHMLSGAKRYACLHYYNAYIQKHIQTGDQGGPTLPPAHFPGSIEPGETIDVTFYTHLEKEDIAIKIEFKKLGICIDPNSGDRISCHMKY